MALKILGVKIDNLNKAEVLMKAASFLSGDRQYYIVTINPEFIMAAQRDEEFKGILNKADLAIADGMGIKLAARKFGAKLKQRLAGVDLMQELAILAGQQNKSIFLLGAKKHGVVEQTAYRLLQAYPGLKIAGAESGYRRFWHRQLPDEKIVEMINRRRPDILFVAFGQVKQEKWIYRNLPKLTSVKLAMGVGGSFDYISGHIRRAPPAMRRLGLEWLYRMFRQPWRLPRIITAVISFSWAVFRFKKK